MNKFFHLHESLSIKKGKQRSSKVKKHSSRPKCFASYMSSLSSFIMKNKLISDEKAFIAVCMPDKNWSVLSKLYPYLFVLRQNYNLHDSYAKIASSWKFINLCMLVYFAKSRKYLENYVWMKNIKQELII